MELPQQPLAIYIALSLSCSLVQAYILATRLENKGTSDEKETVDFVSEFHYTYLACTCSDNAAPRRKVLGQGTVLDYDRFFDDFADVGNGFHMLGLFQTHPSKSEVA